VAKNKNQNRQREQHDQHERQDQRSGEGMEPQERGAMTEQHVMPAAPQSARKGQKKFGHN
jgi:hypothetical protein